MHDVSDPASENYGLIMAFSGCMRKTESPARQGSRSREVFGEMVAN
jgi:hypothetical protein